MRVALTIAGSDSGGGAGIQADLKTFAAHGVYGTCAITAVTAQNTQGVHAVHVLPPAAVRAQIDAVVDDFGAAAVKLGMLANAAIARAVCDAIDAHRLAPVVLDPVMVAKGGARLLDEEAVEVIRRDLLPRCAIVTPNIPEAEVLTGLRIGDPASMGEAARALLDAGAGAVLIKGGHLDSAIVIDLLADPDGEETYSGPRQRTIHTHGTGCTLSAAIAARLAAGRPLREAVSDAVGYVRAAIASAPGLGQGHGPLNHFPSNLY